MKKSILSNPAFRYIFEVIVIVFSVTLSFYIQDVLNKREKIELKNKGLSGVLMELERDVFHFNLATRILKNRILMGQDFLNGKTTNENLNQLMLTYSFAGNNSNYDSMVSTGVIEFIGDKSISREIVNYYETNYSMLYDMSEQLKKIYFEFTFYMKKNYPINSMFNITGEESYESWSDLMNMTKFDYSEKTLKILNSDSEFRNHIYNMRKVKLYYIKFYEDALNINQKLSSSIMEELK